MAYPKAFALHKVGLADTAVRKALAAYTPQAADSVQEDAARWRMAVLIGNEVMMHPDKRTHATAGDSVCPHHLFPPCAAMAASTAPVRSEPL